MNITQAYDLVGPVLFYSLWDFVKGLYLGYFILFY